ncbi:TPA: tetratricopeptide repeat protein [Burkholderia aenigmatica]|uniref:tetratricopeptide repeat protein n=1 Tax=Burkholderia sp. AU45251 TaxID=3059204 RepID=UPI002653618A|nr:tetratricopeptide repeat protein [Burkholderia sp. AU45251]HDR9481188.1 tetratricopeptide repeat protein [Burkholderia aenigmatica]MDN7514192.1 tetratricopeptide repeat protein [Burkholderia sp. AU45251]HDR9512714.1 tetratricopeptide repeat protein [Burkholderia aenigmatica]HDR9592987.1 tetratricopeptide repeat protein [Burkholderia aenigmatica]HDR9601113.1 tetratricopeptide repeat protein [Burkholderia aenigmatica]
MKRRSVLRVVFLCSLVLSAPCVFASAGKNKVTGDFEGVGKPGVFTSEVAHNGLDIKYYSPSLQRTLSYRVENFDECSMMGMYVIPHANLLAVDGSCPSQGGQIYRYIYQWSANDKNWCLIRQINGEKSDITSGTVVPTEDVLRVSGCAPIGKSDSLIYESKNQVRNEIRDELIDFKRAALAQSSLGKYIAGMLDFNVAEIAAYIDADNVEDVNNLAFYLEKYKRNDDALQILQSLVKKFPNRTVARLNLADAYWGGMLKNWLFRNIGNTNVKWTRKGCLQKFLRAFWIE